MSVLNIDDFWDKFYFFVTKILTLVDEIFRWKTPSVTKFYFIKENFGRRNKIFVKKLLAMSLGRWTRYERIFVGEYFCRRNLDFQWQNILLLKVNFLVVNIGRSVEKRLRHRSSNRLNNMHVRCGNYVVNNRNCSVSSRTRE